MHAKGGFKNGAAHWIRFLSSGIALEMVVSIFWIQFGILFVVVDPDFGAQLVGSGTSHDAKRHIVIVGGPGRAPLLSLRNFFWPMGPIICIVIVMRPDPARPSPNATYFREIAELGPFEVRFCVLGRHIHLMGGARVSILDGKGLVTCPPQVGAGSLSFCWFSRSWVVFLGLPAGFPTFPALV